MKKITIQFEPEGRKVETNPDLNILEIAQDAGIGIRSECGGKAICGKCRIIIQDQRPVSKLTDAERRLLSEDEIFEGYRLACSTIAKGDLVVEIPEESRIRIRRMQITGMELPVKLDPLVKKFHVVLPKATLQDIRPDAERLLDSLESEYRITGLELNQKILSNLPDIIREKNWEVTVVVWNGKNLVALESGDTSNILYGFAVDIGTSKLVGYLVNLRNGETEEIVSVENPQISCGEDLMTRISYTLEGENNLKRLQRMVVGSINSLMKQACDNVGITTKNIYELTIVGNTAMHHFFLGIQPKYVSYSPYAPAVKSPLNVRASNLNLAVEPEVNVYVLPCVAGFVGADAVGDAIASGVCESEERSLLIDIGTNTEVFVGNSEDIIACSCASGPAFEGAHIKYGMKAVTGAIEKIKINSGNLEVSYETIDDEPPVGICGSGILDGVAELIRTGVINIRGRFTNMDNERLIQQNGKKEFVIAWGNETVTGKEITITQADIGEIQLSKGAIHTGVAITMRRRGYTKEDLGRVYIAGAFGYHIDPMSAKIIGMLPDIPTEKIKFVGNTAITGAKMCLTSRETREKAHTLSKKIRYLELAVDPDFQKEFVNSMYIPYKNMEEYPTVIKLLKKKSE
ncbi:MAG: ASKHA domain-containing protein [Candidatus Jordarchaeum sp.]|uniref:ASKHA domain-containing protein n=1 Tax=Candidatus Jordarchaeum sp. TaxID=2823881 RepID=UPI004049EE24